MTEESEHDDIFYDLGISNLFPDVDTGSSAGSYSDVGSGAGSSAGSKRASKLNKFNKRTTKPKFNRFKRFNKIMYSDIYVLMKNGRVHILQKTSKTSDCIVSPIKQYFIRYEYLNYLSTIRKRIYWGPKNYLSKTINEICHEKSIFNDKYNYYTLIGKYELLAVKKIEDLWIGYTTNYEYIFFEQKFQFNPFINKYYPYGYFRLVSKYYKNPTDFNKYFEHLQKELESSY